MFTHDALLAKANERLEIPWISSPFFRRLHGLVHYRVLVKENYAKKKVIIRLNKVNIYSILPLSVRVSFPAALGFTFTFTFTVKRHLSFVLHICTCMKRINTSHCWQLAASLSIPCTGTSYFSFRCTVASVDH